MRFSTAAQLLVLLYTTTAGAAGSGGDVEEARKGIDATNAKYRQAVQKGEAAAIAELYTPDAIVMPNDAPIVRGRKGIEEMWKEVFAAGAKDLVLKTITVERNGEVAWEVGEATFKSEPPGGKPVDEATKYLVVWKLGGDGTWLLDRDIWNRNAPAK
jgi:uncharacterized protein (TIGR02246 family)